MSFRPKYNDTRSWRPSTVKAPEKEPRAKEIAVAESDKMPSQLYPRTLAASKIKEIVANSERDPIGLRFAFDSSKSEAKAQHCSQVFDRGYPGVGPFKFAKEMPDPRNAPNWDRLSPASQARFIKQVDDANQKDIDKTEKYNKLRKLNVEHVNPAIKIFKDKFGSGLINNSGAKEDVEDGKLYEAYEKIKAHMRGVNETAIIEDLHELMTKQITWPSRDVGLKDGLDFLTLITDVHDEFSKTVTSNKQRTEDMLNMIARSDEKGFAASLESIRKLWPQEQRDDADKVREALNQIHNDNISLGIKKEAKDVIEREVIKRMLASGKYVAKRDERANAANIKEKIPEKTKQGSWESEIEGLSKKGISCRVVVNGKACGEPHYDSKHRAVMKLQENIANSRRGRRVGAAVKEIEERANSAKSDDARAGDNGRPRQNFQPRSPPMQSFYPPAPTQWQHTPWQMQQQSWPMQQQWPTQWGPPQQPYFPPQRGTFPPLPPARANQTEPQDDNYSTMSADQRDQQASHAQEHCNMIREMTADESIQHDQCRRRIEEIEYLMQLQIHQDDETDMRIHSLCVRVRRVETELDLRRHIGDEQVEYANMTEDISEEDEAEAFASVMEYLRMTEPVGTTRAIKTEDTKHTAPALKTEAAPQQMAAKEDRLHDADLIEPALEYIGKSLQLMTDRIEESERRSIKLFQNLQEDLSMINAKQMSMMEELMHRTDEIARRTSVSTHAVTSALRAFGTERDATRTMLSEIQEEMQLARHVGMSNSSATPVSIRDAFQYTQFTPEMWASMSRVRTMPDDMNLKQSTFSHHENPMDREDRERDIRLRQSLARLRPRSTSPVEVDRPPPLIESSEDDRQRTMEPTPRMTTRSQTKACEDGSGCDTPPEFPDVLTPRTPLSSEPLNFLTPSTADKTEVEHANPAQHNHTSITDTTDEMLDSGASKSFITDDKGTVKVGPAGGNVVFGGDSSLTMKMGARVTREGLPGTAIVVKGLSQELHSVSQYGREGYDTLFHRGRCYIFSRINLEIFRSGTERGGLYFLDKVTDLSRSILEILQAEA